MAGYVARMVYKRPFAARMAFLCGPMLLPVAAAAYFLASSAPGLTLTITILSILAFCVLDAMVTVPSFDLMARGLPQRRRVRTQGLAPVSGCLIVRSISYPAVFITAIAFALVWLVLSAKVPSTLG